MPGLQSGIIDAGHVIVRSVSDKGNKIGSCAVLYEALPGLIRDLERSYVGRIEAIPSKHKVKGEVFIAVVDTGGELGGDVIINNATNDDLFADNRSLCVIKSKPHVENVSFRGTYG